MRSSISTSWHWNSMCYCWIRKHVVFLALLWPISASSRETVRHRFQNGQDGPTGGWWLSMLRSLSAELLTEASGPGRIRVGQWSLCFSFLHSEASASSAVPPPEAASCRTTEFPIDNHESPGTIGKAGNILPAEFPCMSLSGARPVMLR